MDHVTIADRGYAKSLTGLHPAVSAERLIAELVPPPRFADARFSTYLPDPAEPSQTATSGTGPCGQAAAVSVRMSTGHS